MSKARIILCNGAKSSGTILSAEAITMHLNSHGLDAGVHINFANVAKAFARQLNPRLKDMLEIAAFVYSADCGVRRGKGWDDGSTTERWSRNSHFVIPVRDVNFWNDPAVKGKLVEIIQFLADDTVTFEFALSDRRDQDQMYLEYGDDEEWPCYGVDRVLMFSGGLDSLAGAVETASINSGKGLVLVSHRPVSTLDNRQRTLISQFRQLFPVPITHVPVWVNKHANSGESTQRTRSLLFASLGTAVAEGVRAGGVRFFENGVVSLNLPVADEVLRSRASRTTHPISLDLFTDLFSMITGRTLIFDNPYVYLTKSEVVSIIAKYNSQKLIPNSCSCSHQMFKSKTQLHCGTCSQCIDRRIAIIAAGMEADDNADDYETDVFTGPRKDGYEKNMAVNYARHAIELSKMSDTAIITKFNMEISRAARNVPKPSQAARSFVEMFQRHGQTVSGVLQKEYAIHAAESIEGKLDDSCMLSLIASGRHKTSSWLQYADRVTAMLRKGLPISCKTQKPKNELHLQEICDGILKANDNDLQREFPFMPWASSLTKPDWSNENLYFWIELKYVRKTADIRPITEAIAADITKYGDNGRKVLFAVYDPNHLITDEAKFSKDIDKRETMYVQFIR